VITVSEYAKHEICSHLGIDPRKVDVAYHGADRLFYEVSPIVREGEPYLLHVSAAQAKKNIDRLLAAYERLEVADKPRLVVVAPGLMRDLPVSGVDVIRRPMTHWELAPLYAGAVAFVFPSLHETFGMPILEAMAAGCPVITSSSTACPEIAGGCALLVDPWSVEDIAAGMRRLLDDEGLRSTLGRRGRERARAFTWDRSAAAHLAAFHRALS
jgi:glycosyltransferase involved in cell wall biosynthesis